MVTLCSDDMECSIESLPFLVSEAQRARVQAWRRAAVGRERRHAARRLEQLRQLQSYVAARLQQLDEATSERQTAPQQTVKDSLTVVTSSTQQLALTETHTSTPLIDVQGPRAILPTTPPSQEPHTSSPPHRSPVSVKRDGGHRKFKVPPAPRPPGDVYTKLTALGRGFLTRRLLQSNKISNLIKTIKDGSEVLAGITEPVSKQDMALHNRVSTQLQLARVSLLTILRLPAAERMTYIAQSRLSRQQKREREKVSGVSAAPRGRLSLATQRLIDRRHRSSPAIPATQDHKETPTQPKPAPQRDNRDRFSHSGGRGMQLRPVGHGKTTPQASRPTKAAVGARQAKTNIPSKTSGQAKRAPPVSGQPSRSGQTKLGRQPIAGHNKPVKYVAPVHRDNTSKKMRTQLHHT